MHILNNLSFYQYFFIGVFIYLYINLEFKIILNFDHNKLLIWLLTVPRRMFFLKTRLENGDEFYFLVINVI